MTKEKLTGLRMSPVVLSESLGPQGERESAQVGPSVIKSASVSRLSLVRVDHNRYSVPADRHLTGVLVKLFTDRVDLCQGDTVIASHRRCYSHSQSIMAL